MNEQDAAEPTPSEARRAKQAIRERFLEWCKQNGEDPDDEGAWDSFNETDPSTFWGDMDADNRAGHTDNMNKE
jgi:hypothetical protein